MDWEQVGYDAMVLPEWEKKRMDDLYNQERASKALSGIVGSILAQSGEIPLDPTSADFGEQAAMRQGRMGEQLLQGIGSHPDVGYINPSQIGSLTNSALNLGTKPLEFRTKEWEKSQNKRAEEELKQRGKIDLQEQRASDRMALEQERKTKIRELQMLRANGDITDEEYKQAVMVNFGLQPQARQSPGPLEIFKQLQTMPPEQRSAFYNHQREMNPKAFQINTGGGDKASNYHIQPDEQGNLLRINKLTGAVEPLGVKGKGATANPGQQASARREINGMLDDPNNYLLTPEQRKKFDNKLAISLQDTQLRPEALADINAIATSVNLPPYHQPKVKYNITNWAGGDGGQEEGWGQVRPTQQAAPMQSQAPAQRPQVGGQQLDQATAAAILQEAGGNKDRARAIARKRGYKF